MPDTQERTGAQKKLKSAKTPQASRLASGTEHRALLDELRAKFLLRLKLATHVV